MKLTKENIEKFIKDFETNPITVKWIESVENRGRYQREMDKEFFDLSKETINRLIDLILLMRALYGGLDKIKKQIINEQTKHLNIVQDLENNIKKLKHGNKS